MNTRTLTSLDRLLAGCERALEAIAGSPTAQRPSPAAGIAETDMDDAERRHAAGLMRINHTGEVCAQALYFGQAALARSADNRDHLLHAAAEETDHLAWCAQRLQQLESRPSLLNPLWYAGSYAIGAVAALAGDALSLGFVVETERQVEAHLAGHLARIPAQDLRTRAIIEQMKTDEAGHAALAQQLGAAEFPAPVKWAMAWSSRLMTRTVYWV